MSVPDPFEKPEEAMRADPRCEEVTISVSDLHLSEGKILRVRKRTVWQQFRHWVGGRRMLEDDGPFVEIDNPLEDFPHDGNFSDFLDVVKARYGDAASIMLNLVGDVLDPLVVTWFGRFEDPPFETVAVRKARKIIAGHPGFFDALARFLRDPRCRINFFVGNHDQFLVWLRVQKELVRRIAGEDRALAARIGFVSRERNFQLEHRGVLYYHGNNAELQNAIHADKAVQEEYLGVKLKRPMLDKPDGSYMVERVCNRIKLKNELVGRVNRGSDMWLYIFLYHRWWGIFAGLTVVWDFIYRRVSFWDVRRKTSLANTLRTVLGTMEDQPVDSFAQKILKDRPELKAVVLGHSHEWRRVSTSRGTYANTGTWSICYDLMVKGQEVLWSRRVLKLVGYWVLVALAAALVFFLAPAGGWDLWAMRLKGWELSLAMIFACLVVFIAFPLLSDRPRLVPLSKLTFVLVRHYDDDSLGVDTMEYLPGEKTVKECV